MELMLSCVGVKYKLRVGTNHDKLVRKRYLMKVQDLSHNIPKLGTVYKRCPQILTLRHSLYDLVQDPLTPHSPSEVRITVHDVQ